MSANMSQERFEDPAGWTDDELLEVLCEDDAVDISAVTDRALSGAIAVAQSQGLAIPLGALEHESGRRSVKRGEAAPAEPAPLPALSPARHEYPASADDALGRGNAAGQLVYADTFMLPAEISLQTAVEIEAFLNERGTAQLNAAEGSISFRIECEDLWDACEAAHEVVAEMMSHGVEAAVDRDLLTQRPTAYDDMRS